MGIVDRLTRSGAPPLPTPGNGGTEPAAPTGKARSLIGIAKSFLTSTTGALRGAPPLILSPRVTQTGSWDEWWRTITEDLDGKSPAALFAQQPHLRTVVAFRARNMAQLGLHVFERVDENDRRRNRSSVTARALASPDGVMTTYELIFATVGDLDLYDRAHWLVVPADRPSGWMIRRLPPAWVTPERQNAFEVTKWRVTYGQESIVIDAGKVLSFTGYSPTDPRRGSSTVEALKGTLQEQIEASLYRSQVWKRGGRVSAVLERPTDAPPWSDPARAAFREDWYSKFTGRGAGAGGTPILEDGMTLRRIDFNAQEQQFVEAAKLSLVTVASSYHVNPTMIGQNDGATYSNVREFRKMLYGDTLGPLSAQLQQRLNAFLIPMLGENPDTLYVEFNIEEKLQGNFEEQSEAIQSSTGAPWMTRNEARALRNLPRIEGGDELVVPLNVLIGGQASPRDGQTGSRSALEAPRKAPEPAGVKVPMPEQYSAQARGVLSRFFSRQGQVVRSHIGAGRDWWDAERWDEELGVDIAGLYMLTATEAGRQTLAQLGIEPSMYDEPRTQAFLRQAARISAEEMNVTTREAVEAAIAQAQADEVPATEPVGRVFDVAQDSRATQAAAAIVAFAGGFGAIEAARQQTQGATKTWVVNSSSPRPQHASMNGETVDIDEVFSNGLEWPGAFGPPEQIAGCQCSVAINIP